MSKQHSTVAAIDIPFGSKTPVDPGRIGVGAELHASCQYGVDGPLAAADAVPRGCLARNQPQADCDSTSQTAASSWNTSDTHHQWLSLKLGLLDSRQCTEEIDDHDQWRI